MIRIDRESREAIHTTLDEVMDKIEQGEIFVDFSLDNYCLQVLAHHGDPETAFENWDMSESYFNTFSPADAMSLMIKLGDVEFINTKQEADTTDGE